MPVDTSFYPQAQQQNPFQMIGTMADLQLKANENRLFQRDFAAKAAAGRLAQAAIDPKTGEFDTAKYVKSVATDPAVGPMAPQIIAESLQLNKAKAELVGKQLENAFAKSNALANVAATIPELNPGYNPKTDPPYKAYLPVDPAKINDASALLRANYTGIFSKEEEDRFRSSIPQNPEVQGFFFANLAAQQAQSRDAFKYTAGELKDRDYGPRIATQRTGGVAGQTQTLQNLNRGLSPEQNLSGVQTVGPDGTPSLQTRNEYFGQPNNPNPGLGAAPGAPNPFVQGPPGAYQQQQNPLAPQPVAQPLTRPAPQPQAQAVPPAARAPTGLSPVQDFQVKNIADYTKGVQEEQDTSNSLHTQIAELRALTEGVKTGGLGDFRAKMGQFMQGLGVPKEYTDSVANGSLGISQAFKKLGIQLATNQLKFAVGGQGRLTNLEFGVFNEAHPTLDTDPQAIRLMLGFLDKMADVPVLQQKFISGYLREHGNSIDELSQLPDKWNDAYATLLRKQYFEVKEKK